MTLLLLVLNAFMLISFKSVLSGLCNFCVDLASECDKPQNILVMDCDHLNITHIPAINYVKEPQIIKELFVTPEQWQNLKHKFIVGCVDFHYQFEHLENGKVTEHTNSSYEAAVETGKKFAFQTCLLEHTNISEKFCDLARVQPSFLEMNIPQITHFKFKVDNCTFTTNFLSSVNGTDNDSNSTNKTSSSLSTLSDRSVVFVMPMVLLMLFI